MNPVPVEDRLEPDFCMFRWRAAAVIACAALAVTAFITRDPMQGALAFEIGFPLGGMIGGELKSLQAQRRTGRKGVRFIRHPSFD